MSAPAARARLTGWKGQKMLVEAAAKPRDAGLTDAPLSWPATPRGGIPT